MFVFSTVQNRNLNSLKEIIRSREIIKIQFWLLHFQTDFSKIFLIHVARFCKKMIFNVAHYLNSGYFLLYSKPFLWQKPQNLV